MSPIERSAGGGTAAPTIGSSTLIYRFTVAGAAKSVIDTGVDAAQAGSNDWTNGDVLEVWMTVRTDDAAAASSFTILLNNDAGANYDRQSVSGSVSTAAAGVLVAQNNLLAVGHGAGGSASYPAVTRLSVPDYAGTTFFKQIEGTVARNDATGANNVVQAVAWGWRSTAAITRLSMTATAAQNFVIGTQLLIYKRLAS